MRRDTLYTQNIQNGTDYWKRNKDIYLFHSSRGRERGKNEGGITRNREKRVEKQKKEGEWWVFVVLYWWLFSLCIAWLNCGDLERFLNK